MQRFRGKKTTLGATALSPRQMARGALRPGAGAGGAQGPGGRGPVVPTTLWVPPWGRDAFPSHRALALPTRSEQGDVCHSSTLVTSVLKTPAGLQLTVAGAGCETQDPGQQQRLGGKVTACRAGGGTRLQVRAPGEGHVLHPERRSSERSREGTVGLGWLWARGGTTGRRARGRRSCCSSQREAVVLKALLPKALLKLTGDTAVPFLRQLSVALFT